MSYLVLARKYRPDGFDDIVGQEHVVRTLKNAIQHGNPDTASQAKYTLAQVYAAQGKEADAQKIYRELMNSPSLYVSKEQATIALAQSLVRTNPEEARKVIEPLKSMKSPAITEAVINITAELK